VADRVATPNETSMSDWPGAQDVYAIYQVVATVDGGQSSPPSSGSMSRPRLTSSAATRRPSSIDSSMPIALVTGANRGIGLAVARDLAKDHDVIMAVRDPGRPLRSGVLALRSSTFPTRIRSLPVPLESRARSTSWSTMRVCTPVRRTRSGQSTCAALSLLTRALAGKLAKGARVVM